MDKIYLLKKDKVMLGPYSFDKIKIKAKPNDLVWNEGLKDWTPAGNIFNLEVTEIATPDFQIKDKLSFKIFIKKIFTS